MVSSPRTRHGIENKKFLIVLEQLRRLFMQNREKDFYVELRLYCDSDARTRRRLRRIFFFGGKVRSGTNGQGRWYVCVLRRSQPSPNHLSCQLFLLVDYSWGLLLTTRMINDVRREAHVHMCNPFSFALAWHVNTWKQLLVEWKLGQQTQFEAACLSEGRFSTLKLGGWRATMNLGMKRLSGD